MTDPVTVARTGTPPCRDASGGVVSDTLGFLLHRPEIPTQVSVESDTWREDYTSRIAQRTGVDVSVYSILNIHRIEIDAPVETVFDEVERWSGGSPCWPDHIATIEEYPGEQDGLRVVAFGRTPIMRGLRRIFGPQLGTLFRMSVVEARRIPDAADADNARFFLWRCSGGYPIGVFSIFVRSGIPERGEPEATQMFFAVGFNPFGRKLLGRIRPFRTLWQSVHDRVTSNVMNRFKRLCELPPTAG